VQQFGFFHFTRNGRARRAQAGRPDADTLFGLLDGSGGLHPTRVSTNGLRDLAAGSTERSADAGAVPTQTPIISIAYAYLDIPSSLLATSRTPFQLPSGD